MDQDAFTKSNPVQPPLEAILMHNDDSTSSNKSRHHEVDRSWHTFRQSYATLLIANEEKVKVIQELLHHGRARITVDI
jgi:site-specific recombinase XerD